MLKSGAELEMWKQKILQGMSMTNFHSQKVRRTKLIMLLAGLILSVHYTFRIPGFRRVTAEQFPNIDPQIVMQWRMLELRSIYALLVTTIGMIMICLGILALMLSLKSNMDDNYFQLFLKNINGICMMIIIGGMCVAGNYGAQAGKLRKAYGLSVPGKK